MSRTPAQLLAERTLFQKFYKDIEVMIEDVNLAPQGETAIRVDLTEAPAHMRPRLKAIYDKLTYDTTMIQADQLRISWAPTTALRGQPVTQVVEAGEPSPRPPSPRLPAPSRPLKRAASAIEEAPVAKRTRREEAAAAVRVLAVEDHRGSTAYGLLEFAVRYDDEDRATPLWQPWQNLCEWDAPRQRWTVTEQLLDYLKTAPTARGELGATLVTTQPDGPLPWEAKPCAYVDTDGTTCGGAAEHVVQGVAYCLAHTCPQCQRRKMLNGKGRCSRCRQPVDDEEED